MTMSRQETRDPKLIRKNPNDTRQGRDAEAFRLLVESVRQQGILQPPGILPDNTNVWGWGRVLAAIEVGLKEIPVTVLPSTVAGGQPAVLTAIENLVRSDLKSGEVLLTLENVQLLNPTWSQKALATNIGMQEATVCRHLAVGKNPLLREPLLAGKLNMAVAYKIATAAPEAQAELLQQALSGPVTRESITKAARVRNSPDLGTEKLGRVVCPLSTGTRIVVTGAALSLDSFIDALQTALEAARKSSKEKLDIKTAMKVWADRSRVVG
jgi:ParB-like chromosome segregation protein Spo0J